MKVLIVSHNSMSETSNMGKTLSSYFREFAPEELAQFYIHCEEPVDNTRCHNYYRFTDRDALQSLFPFSECGRIFRKEDIRADRITARTDAGILGRVYQFGRKRTAWIYALRNALWKCSRWDTKQFWNWVDDFAPDIVFFASGDYGFLYDIARRIAQHVGKPLVASCVDDFYLHNRNKNSILGCILYRSFMKSVRKTIAYAEGIFTICPDMQKAYEELFEKKCYVLYTAAEEKQISLNPDATGIAYLGNLGLKRNGQLVTMGRALQRIDVPGVSKFIDVYSGERNPQILKDLTPENGIRFHGAVSSEEVFRVMGSSMAVIHTESFDPEIQSRIRFSISTKIGETLMNGPCLIAYGPEGVASIDYLKENGAAYTITERAQLEAGLREILTNAQLRGQIVTNARKLANANHSMQINPAKVKAWLAEMCGE